MDLFAPRHLLIILLVCLLVFGTKKLRTIGADLGAAVRGFKNAMADDSATVSGTPRQVESEATQTQQVPNDITAINHSDSRQV